MRITRIECDRFMKFRDKRLEFPSGLSVVFGPNEAGKTTVQRFLKVMLYGCGLRKTGDREAVIPWDEDRAAGKLILELERTPPRRLRVERVIRADRPSTPHIYDDETNRDLTGELGAEGHFPANLIGLDMDAFERTVWVKQATLGDPRIHRIIRLGAVYGSALPDGVLEDDGAERGIFFMFMSARADALEFLKRDWIDDGNTFGLGSERDPIAGNNDGQGTFTIPARPVRRRLHGLERFTVTRGGEYAFVPSLTALRWLADLDT